MSKFQLFFIRNDNTVSPYDLLEVENNANTKNYILNFLKKIDTNYRIVEQIRNDVVIYTNDFYAIFTKKRQMFKQLTQCNLLASNFASKKSDEYIYYFLGNCYIYFFENKYTVAEFILQTR